MIFFRFSNQHNKFTVQFYNRLNKLVEKGIQTYSRECQHPKSNSSILLKHLMPDSASRISSKNRQKEDNNRCKNIRMVLKYAQKLLC